MRWWAMALVVLSTGCVRSRPLHPAYALGEEQPTATEGDRAVIAVLGDSGYEGPAQRAVAASVVSVCQRLGGCDAGLLLGDNIYPSGLDPVDRGVCQADTRDDPFCGLRGPADEEGLFAARIGRYQLPVVYSALGNHDYDPFFPDPKRARAQINFLRLNADCHHGRCQARLLADGSELERPRRGGFHFYTAAVGPITLVALDTDWMVRDDTLPQHHELLQWSAGIGQLKGWRVAFGHHPLISNGKHGNAGYYCDGVPLWSGERHAKYLNDYIVDRVHLYLSGHDHNLQFLRRGSSDTGFAVVGAASKCTSRGQGYNQADMEHYGYGFAVVVADAETLTLRFYDFAGGELWSTQRTRDGGWTQQAEGPRDPLSHCDADLDVARLCESSCPEDATSARCLRQCLEARSRRAPDAGSSR